MDKPPIKPPILTKYIRTLRGGSQPHLMQADDGYLYVVKFQGNPQGTAVLANELIATKLAGNLGLSVPTTVVVKLPPELSTGLHFETTAGRTPIRPGLHLGSRLVINSADGRSYDVLPQRFRQLIRNVEHLIGIQLFDFWACNRDRRQVVFWKYGREKKYTATFIDNGHCFGGPEWKFDSLILPKCALTEPSWIRWLDRIATFPIQSNGMVIGLIPPEWCIGLEGISNILDQLRIRQRYIAEQIRDKLNNRDVGLQ